MFCDYCGRNLIPSEGFEEMNKRGHRVIRCEKCGRDQREEEYDWRTEMSGKGHRMQGGKS